MSLLVKYIIEKIECPFCGRKRSNTSGRCPHCNN